MQNISRAPFNRRKKNDNWTFIVATALIKTGEYIIHEIFHQKLQWNDPNGE